MRLCMDLKIVTSANAGIALPSVEPDRHGLCVAASP